MKININSRYYVNATEAQEVPTIECTIDQAIKDNHNWGVIVDAMEETALFLPDSNKVRVVFGVKTFNGADYNAEIEAGTTHIDALKEATDYKHVYVDCDCED